MDNIKNIIGGGIITLVIGGAAFTFTQEDLTNNFVQETGFTEEQAEEYINDIEEDDWITFTEFGEDYLLESLYTLDILEDLDCEEVEYEWETDGFTCDIAEEQIIEISEAESALGKNLIQLDSPDADTEDIEVTIAGFDAVNDSYRTQAATVLFDEEFVSDTITNNSFNKALLLSGLEEE